MPIIAKVGRKDIGVRFTILAIYLLLILGGITMVYPFLLMVKISISSKMDNDDYGLPRFLYDENLLMAKYLNERHSYWTGPMALRYHRDYGIWKDLITPVAQKVYPLDDSTRVDRIRKAAEKLKNDLEARIHPKDQRLITAKNLILSHLQRILARKTPYDDPLLTRLFERNYVELGERLGEIRDPKHSSVLRIIRKDIKNLEALRSPKFDLNDKKVMADVQRLGIEWLNYKKTLPLELKQVNFMNYSNNGKNQRAFQEFVKKKYGGDISRVNRIYEDGVTYFSEILAPHGGSIFGVVRSRYSAKDRDWIAFNKTLKEEEFCVRYWEGNEARWGEFFADQVKRYALKNAPEKYHRWEAYFNTEYSVEAINDILGTSFIQASCLSLPLPDKGLLKNRVVRGIWKRFLLENRENLNFLRINVTKKLQERFSEYLQKKYGTVSRLNRVLSRELSEGGTKFRRFEDYELAANRPLETMAMRRDWDEFVRTQCPIEYIQYYSYEARWRDYLRQKYAKIENFNKTLKTRRYRSFSEVPAPFAEYDLYDYLKHRKGLRWRFVWANYRYALDRLFFNGRAAYNTLVLVALSLFTALTVNPLAAYALSRFRLSYAHKVLLFFLATMAFPPEVTMIPNFLLIKELGLLNSYAALVLPGMANGFSIFLLKGFFDSIPLSLYEAAELDGANNFQMFYKITLPLSKPVLAVIALNTFMYVYGSYLWALLICPARKFWTIMVFVTQFQQVQLPHQTMAALVLAALPPLIVFVLCQKVIMRGIVIPQSK
ncbi:MAG: carbohydrate ABC transporter permease [Candidatus Hydrogenedentota bacterium]|nr:MAG: carbohydrate ABC transporter permease [Candidatus Hydrogenedentota bacterium]